MKRIVINIDKFQSRAAIIENGKVFTLDKDGEKKSEATGLSLPYAGWKIQYRR